MSKIEYRTLNEKAYQKLKKGLTSGRFRPAEILVIRQLAERYGISATPVREALQRLVAERALELLPNRSIAVPVLTAEKFTELRHIRCALEGLAAEFATPNFKPSHMRRLMDLIKAMDRDIANGNTSAYLDHNERFHFFVYARAEAPLLLQMIQDLWTQVGPFFNFLFQDCDYLPDANEGHRNIYAAIERRDPAALREAVVHDIVSAANSLSPRLAERAE